MPGSTIGLCRNPVEKLGTQLSLTATHAMQLGAGKLGKGGIIALPRLGVETIAVDCHANVPGMPAVPKTDLRLASFSNRRTGVAVASRAKPASA